MANLELIERLKAYIPMYLWERINHPAGYVVNNEEFNTRWNLSATQGDHHAITLTDMVALLLDILESAGIDPLATINDVQFFSDGYEVTYTDGVKKTWQYETDNWGFITRLVNQTDQRPIVIGWHETPLGG